MPENDVDILGRIIVDSSDADSKLRDFTDSTNAVGDGMNQVGIIGDFVWGQLIVKGIEAAVGAIQDLAQGVQDFVASTIDMAAEEQDSLAQLYNEVTNLGAAAPETAQQMIDMADAIGQTTTFGHDAARSAEIVLARFKEIGTVAFPLVMQAGEDLAAGTGRNLVSVMQLLGRTLENPTAGMAGLRRMNIILTETQKDSIKTLQAQGDLLGAQQVILDAVSAAYGGSAKAAAATYNGQMAILNDTFAQIKGTIGEAFLPLLTAVVSMFQSFASDTRVRIFFEDVATVITNVLTPIEKLVEDFTAFGVTGGKVYDDLVGIFGQNLGGQIMAILDAVTNLFSKIEGGFASGGLAGAFKALFAGLPNLGTDLFTALSNIFKSIDWNGIITTILGWAVGLTQAFKDTMAAIDWKAVGTSIITWIQGIDWANIGFQIQTMVGNLLAGLNTFLTTFPFDTVFATASTAFADFVVGLLAAKKGMKWADVQAEWYGIGATWSEIVKNALTKAGQGTGGVNIGAALLSSMFNWTNSVKQVHEQGLAMKEVLDEIFGKLGDIIGGWIQKQWNMMGGLITAGWNALLNIIYYLWTTFMTTWAGNIQAFKDIFKNIITDLTTIGKNIIGGLLDGLKNAWKDVEAWFTTSITSIPAWMKKLLGIKSPSSVFYDIGAQMMAGLAGGLQGGLNMPMTILANAVPALTGAAGSSGSGGAVTTQNISFQISGAGDPKAVANEIATLLRLNGIQTL